MLFVQRDFNLANLIFSVPPKNQTKSKTEQKRPKGTKTERDRIGKRLSRPMDFSDPSLAGEMANLNPEFLVYRSHGTSICDQSERWES